MSVLDEILQHKRIEVEQAKENRPFARVREEAEALAQGKTPRFRQALTKSPEVALIAEVKKASPSKGVIREDFDPVELAQWYVKGGASAISVLTDTRYFQGGLDHLDLVRQAVDVPLLRKEFIVDPYQLYEAVLHGADAALLIVAALEPHQLESMIALCGRLGLDALVEVHTKEELQVALDAGAGIIGINNRDLKTFDTSLQVSEGLIPHIPSDKCIVSESGISRPEDLEFLGGLGVDAVLVGEALSKQADVEQKVRELLGKVGASS